MVLDLDCTIADVSARALGLRLDGPLPDVLSDVFYSASYENAETQLVLGVIGASHVATVTYEQQKFREEISCHAAGKLPSDMAQGRYTMKSAIFAPDDFSQYAARWLEQSTDWHVARFPGTGEHHLTGVIGNFVSKAWEWETMHFYPGEGLIVHTQSRYEL